MNITVGVSGPSVVTSGRW